MAGVAASRLVDDGEMAEAAAVEVAEKELVSLHGSFKEQLSYTVTPGTQRALSGSLKLLGPDLSSG